MLSNTPVSGSKPLNRIIEHTFCTSASVCDEGIRQLLVAMSTMLRFAYPLPLPQSNQRLPTTSLYIFLDLDFPDVANRCLALPPFFPRLLEQLATGDYVLERTKLIECRF